MPIVITGKSKKFKNKDREVRKEKKRKKEKSNLPVPLSKREQKLLKRNLTKTERILSLFGQDSGKIQELVNGKDNDTAFDLANRTMLSSLLDILPIAESKYREDPRQSNAYAMGSIISQIRELISDLQASGDQSVVANRIIETIIQPTMMTLAQFLIDTNYQLKRDLADSLNPERLKQAHTVIDNNSKAAGTYVSAMYNDLKDKVGKALVK